MPNSKLIEAIVFISTFLISLFSFSKILRKYIDKLRDTRFFNKLSKDIDYDDGEDDTLLTTIAKVIKSVMLMIFVMILAVAGRITVILPCGLIAWGLSRLAKWVMTNM